MHQRHPKGAHRASSKRRLKWGVVFCTAAALSVGSVSAISASHHHHHIDPAPTHSYRSPQSHTESAPSLFHDGRRTILLIGTDARKTDPMGNADVMMLCSVDEANERLELLSIPRDTKIRSVQGNATKLNALLQEGGPSYLTAQVSQLLDTPIDDYVVVHFPCVVDVVDALGGIDMTVPKRMYTRTGDKQYGLIDLRPGKQHLDGEQALAFVRFRHDALGDIGRTRRQQQFFRAVMAELARPQNIARLPGVAAKSYAAFDTDISMLDGIRLAAAAESFSKFPLVSGTLPGSFHDPSTGLPGDASYWIINRDQARFTTANLLKHGIAVENPVQDLSITAHWRQNDSPTATSIPGTNYQNTDGTNQMQVSQPGSKETGRGNSA